MSFDDYNIDFCKKVAEINDKVVCGVGEVINEISSKENHFVVAYSVLLLLKLAKQMKDAVEKSKALNKNEIIAINALVDSAEIQIGTAIVDNTKKP